jgi:hypothetical protein
MQYQRNFVNGVVQTSNETSWEQIIVSKTVGSSYFVRNFSKIQHFAQVLALVGSRPPIPPV